MSYRSSTRAFALAAALMVTVGAARAADDAKYPNWKGQWDAINPALRRPGHQVRSEQGVGTGAAGAADAGVPEGPGRQHGRPGQGRSRQLPERPVPAGRHAAHDGGAGAGIRHHAGNHLYPDRRRAFAASSPTDATGRRRAKSSRPIRAIRSADGSTRMATAATTCSRSRPAARSRDRAPTTRPACRSHFDNEFDLQGALPPRQERSEPAA